MSLRFGTDGVRGVANTELTPTFALALGAAVVDAFDTTQVVIGVDTRRSGSMLAAAVSAGVASAGADAIELEVIPTPAVAREARVRNCPGVMVSASHNAFQDNGLKVFGPGGQKLSDAEQSRIESTIMAILTTGRGVRVVGPNETAQEIPPPTGAEVGRIEWEPQVAEDYVAELVQAGGGDGALDGMVAVLDAAHGAGSAIGPRALRRLGVELRVIGDLPNGININDGVGSTALGPLREAVMNLDGAVGFALDGDADRCLAVDEHGNEIDGDQIIAVCALEMARAGKLDNSAVAVTVMSNLGFRKAMEAAGIGVVVTPVGDRYVVDAMAREGLVLGGEQSRARDLCRRGHHRRWPAHRHPPAAGDGRPAQAAGRADRRSDGAFAPEAAQRLARRSASGPAGAHRRCGRPRRGPSGRRRSGVDPSLGHRAGRSGDG
jgi:phosphoglucosamine mutase